MAEKKLLTIRTIPDEILRVSCEPVTRITDIDRALFRDMLVSMRYFRGIGLAAPQIGIARRIIVAEVNKKIVQLADPEIIKAEGSGSMEEGCLSVPDRSVTIERSLKIKVKGLSKDNKVIEVKAEGLLARVLQHEIDHLKGTLIIDYIKYL